jgi:putative sigma-54 modulation protein
MNTKITALHFKADKKLEDFIQERFGKLEKLSEGILGAETILKLENSDKPDNKTAEIQVKIKGYDLHAEKRHSSFEGAFDQALEAIRKQLSKSKEKMRE